MIASEEQEAHVRYTDYPGSGSGFSLVVIALIMSCITPTIPISGSGLVRV